MSNIGYIICENLSQVQDMKVVGKTASGKPIGEGILQEVEEDNRNGRYYEKAELFPQLKTERTLELLKTGNFKGENGHPMTNDIKRQATIDPNNVCVKFLDIWTEDNFIKARFTGTNNALGESFNRDMLDGELPSFSLRALGSIVNKNGHACVKNIRLITWDRVIYPSHKHAYMERLVSESTDMSEEYMTGNGNKLFIDENYHGFVTPITNEKVVNLLKQESANVNFVMENFSGIYESIELIDNGRSIKLADGKGTALVVNLEYHVQDLLMDYCYKK